GDRIILKEVARRAGSGKLVVATLASSEEQELWESYERIFRTLGVRHVHHLRVESREQVLGNPHLEVLDEASLLFFTGGQQIKITTLIGGTALCRRIEEMY